MQGWSQRQQLQHDYWSVAGHHARDLADLVEKDTLIRLGERGHPRYTLNLNGG
jgi:hypothetical protein